MNPLFSSKLRSIAELSLLGGVAGIVYELLRENFIDFNALLLGMPMGAAFGIIELFFLSGFKQQFNKLPLMASVLIKAVIYLVIITLITGAKGFVVGFFQGKTLQDFYSSMLSTEQLIITLYTLLFFVFLSFYVQINLLLGQGVLLKFLLGKYRKPTAETRIFMFLDIKSSTRLAEKLGLEQYYSLHNDFFS